MFVQHTGRDVGVEGEEGAGPTQCPGKDCEVGGAFCPDPSRLMWTLLIFASSRMLLNLLGFLSLQPGI